MYLWPLLIYVAILLNSMPLSRVVEYVFFFLILAGASYMVWQVLAPFASALALAIVIVTIFYPLYEWIESKVWRNNRSLAAALSTIIVMFLVIIPLVIVSTIFVRELVSLYQDLSAGQEMTLERQLVNFESAIQVYLPEFDLNLTEQIRQTAEWIVNNIGRIFAGTVSMIFIIIISLIGAFYFFRDGREFAKILIKISPLPDNENELILSRLAQAIRSVSLGVLLVALIQGISASIGFSIFGIERAVLWGAIGAVISMIPAVGTLTIMTPGIIFLVLWGEPMAAAGLAVWTFFAMIFIDNMLGPYLMSRGNNLHPFIVLTSVLGGIATFGPIGFIIGPVIVTFFIVLLEMYNNYVSISTSDKKLLKK